ncbi:hypothetical protein R5R35_005403 [Gryllus longicercus]|uniref:Uncharacterized protein n=1 Tax=Gryllus longicercus TaxID=2509291 RepID=A0AAN9Z5R5_9ORTH
MNRDVKPKKKTNIKLTYPVWVEHREVSQRLPREYSDVFYKSLYSSISPCHSWKRGENSRSVHGGLYSLEFSPAGSLLVAGEKRNFRVFDPVSRKLIHTVGNAHACCVTNVKFLDSQVFATGSVDKTVSLWDARNLGKRLRTLRVRTNTIGNIAFSPKTNLLITSGLDGYISTWDITNFAQKNELCRKISWSYVLTRLRLSPDESKMIISTGRGFIMIVHDLDLNTLDLDDFELDLFGLTFLDQADISRFLNWNHFLSPRRRRNRVEIVADYPDVRGINVISSLEIHPRGWSAVSRTKCIMNGVRKHWTCVHDILEKDPSESRAASGGGSGDERPPYPQLEAGEGTAASGSAAAQCVGAQSAFGGAVTFPEREPDQNANQRGNETGRDGESAADFETASEGFCAPSSSNVEFEVPFAEPSGEAWARKRRAVSRVTTGWPWPPPSSAHPGPFEVANNSKNAEARKVLGVLALIRHNQSEGQLIRSVPERYPRLTHYIEEPVASEWYFDNTCFSPDGRLICYPMKRGIRLLSFSPECSEQPITWSKAEPRNLHELKTHVSHSNTVLCTKFSPRHYLLVSGCSGGQLSWYEPVV